MPASVPKSPVQDTALFKRASAEGHDSDSKRWLWMTARTLRASEAFPLPTAVGGPACIANRGAKRSTISFWPSRGRL
eukprot:3167712-Alexandrium_andersonii.AAC.1